MATVTRHLAVNETLEARYAAAFLYGYHRHSDEDLKTRITTVYDFLGKLTEGIDEVEAWKRQDEQDDDGTEGVYELAMVVKVKVIATSKMEAEERASTSTSFWQDWDIVLNNNCEG
jgi:hypothetical protein